MLYTTENGCYRAEPAMMPEGEDSPKWSATIAARIAVWRGQ